MTLLYLLYNIDNWKNTDDSIVARCDYHAQSYVRVYTYYYKYDIKSLYHNIIMYIWFHSLPTSTVTHIVRRYDLRLIHLRRWGGRRRVRATTFLFILNIVFVGEFRRVSGSGICIGNNIIHKVSATERIVNAGHSI